MSVLVRDTDVASSLLRRRTPPAPLALFTGNVLAVSFVTVGELTKWTLVRRRGPARLSDMDVFFRGLVVLPYDHEVATRWGQLQAYAQLRGRPRPVNDTWIASCCLTRGLALATFNTKDFQDFIDHEGLLTVQ